MVEIFAIINFRQLDLEKSCEYLISRNRRKFAKISTFNVYTFWAKKLVLEHT